MRIKILDAPVRHNVEIFLEMIRRVKEKQLQKNPPSEKVFSVWLNRETGQLSFSDLREESEYLGKKEWKLVELSYLYEPNSGELYFLVKEAEEKQALFKSDDLAPSAFRIFRETMKTLAEIGQRLKGPSDLNTKISVLTRLIVDAEVSHGDRNAIIDAWHPVDRLQAESLLQGQPLGTYLFRKDMYADILEEQLQREHHKKIKCFTVTFSAEDHKISDLTFVHIEGVWQVYNDDPSLEQQKFNDIKDLIGSLEGVLKHPLYLT